MTRSSSPVLVLGDAVPSDLGLALELSGYLWKTAPTVTMAERMAPEGGWSALIVVAPDLDFGIAMCRSAHNSDLQLGPILLALPSEKVAELLFVEGLFDDFLSLPLRSGELEARLQLQIWKTTGGTRPDLVEYGALVLNLATYQAAVAGRPLDMTYMEYELLKHFATHPGRVLTREELLRQVWGYEYYGGARTVDVHVRRLRAKLGEEHASLISTVRSVGYMFGKSGGVPPGE